MDFAPLPRDLQGRRDVTFAQFLPEPKHRRARRFRARPRDRRAQSSVDYSDPSSYANDWGAIAELARGCSSSTSARGCWQRSRSCAAWRDGHEAERPDRARMDPRVANAGARSHALAGVIRTAHHEPDPVHDLVAEVPESMGDGRVERDRVSGSELVALEPELDPRRPVRHVAVLPPLVTHEATRPATEEPADVVGHVEEVDVLVLVAREPLPPDAGRELDHVTFGGVHDRPLDVGRRGLGADGGRDRSARARGPGRRSRARRRAR